MVKTLQPTDYVKLVHFVAVGLWDNRSEQRFLQFLELNYV
jgi:hypothetical protein